MSFNSLEFLFLFLPLSLVAFYIATPAYRLNVIFASSIIFSLISGYVAFVFILISLLWGHFMSRVLAVSPSKPKLLLACSGPLLLLFVSKYVGFTVSIFGISINESSSFSFFKDIALPLGISFYTFQIISYLFDIYSGVVKRDNDIVHFSSYITFFPQFIAGPILRYNELSGQLNDVRDGSVAGPNIELAVKYISYGLFYKTMFADVLLVLHERYIPSVQSSSLDTLFSIVAYSSVIYFDFWGYSLMAIGVAKFFSIDLPRNFLEPYKSFSPQEFWRRWHVTLSYWLRDYVYVRLNGKEQYVRNIIITFVLCGLWHGAGWNFILWGAYHAFFVILYHFTAAYWNQLPRFIGVGLTYSIVTISWPLFVYDVSTYWLILQNLVSGKPEAASNYGTVHWVYLSFVTGWVFLFSENRFLFTRNFFFGNPLVYASLAALSVVFLSISRTFIYFRF